MSPRPDFSPAMLRFFLAARQLAAGHGTAAKAELKRLRKLAGVTVAQMEMAVAGRLVSPGPRAALWAVLGHFPSLADLESAP